MPARLKSLELQGYKTFAARTDFQFADTVTAVVGPNGSGKSNIADSIRWVLGEQSYSLLRAKKTEDMIFSGSEQRARAGMASATITFDNSDGWLPIDFSEVAITRRAYRDGQNEYLINGQRVRLKDVSELLAQSGLAERTYTIIGQGLVDAALSLKAEERRRLFEEAAGIGLHRSRREEALKRLETTRHNLERVQDILAELQPRLKSLERQARRMMEYEQVKADLHVLLREWYGFHWHRAQNELRSAKEYARVQENALEKANELENQQDQNLSGVRNKAQGIREDLSQWHKQLSELHSRRESLGRSIAVADERLRSLKEQDQTTLTEISRQEEEQSFFDERLADTQNQLKEMESELEEARQQAVVALHALEARQVERQQAEKALQAARQSLGGITARQSFLSARLDERKSQSEIQNKNLNGFKESVANAEREVLQAEHTLSKAKENLAAAEDLRKGIENRLQEALQTRKDQENKRKEFLDNLNSLQANIARKRAQREVLDQAERELAGYNSGARLLLQSIRQNQLKGAKGALSSELEVPAEYEVAIAAALGEYLDAIVLQEANLDEALELLEGQDARSVLLPEDAVVPKTRLSVDQHASKEGVIGIAADFVKGNQALQPVLDLLLGRVILVRERTIARRLTATLRKGQTGVGVKIVTLTGEVFLTEGPILAGKMRKPGTLSRPREKRELQIEMDALDLEASRLLDSVNQAEVSLKLLAQQEDEIRSDLQAALSTEKKAISDVGQGDLAYEKALRAFNWQQEQQKRLVQDYDQSLSEIEKITQELNQLNADSADARDLVRSHSGTLASLGLDELQTQMAHWNTRTAVAERAHNDILSQLSERRAAVERIGQSVLKLHQRLNEFRSTQIELDKQKALSLQSEKALNDEIETMLAKIRPAEESLDQLEQELVVLQARETESRQSLSQAEHYNAQARIALARRQEMLESLRGRIEDDLGLVAFKYAEEVSGPTPLPLDGWVENLPEIKEISSELDEIIKRQRAQLRRMGPINPEAQSEYIQVKERFEFLTEQVQDSRQAELDIKEVIAELDILMEREFRRTFEAVAQEFRLIFTRLFGGGSARLVLTAPDDMTDTGIDIEARLPGRREQGLSLLSGGERSLTAAALVFSLLKVSPTPFCVFDEVDAMLDEANVGRFRDLLRELSQNTQFVIVTHNRNTVQAADVIYGVTMGLDSASQVISLKLDEVSKVVN